jgi:hypothetical protein
MKWIAYLVFGSVAVWLLGEAAYRAMEQQMAEREMAAAQVPVHIRLLMEAEKWK